MNRWGAAAALYVVVIFWLSSAPRPLPEFLGQLGSIDKALHAVEYGGLGLLVGLAGARARPPLRGLGAWAALWLLCVCVGAGDEMEQAWVPGRSASLLDLVADMLGSATGCALGLMPRRTPR